MPGDSFQRFAANKCGKAPRQGAFGLAGIFAMQHFGDGQAEHAVAEKFEPLIGLHIARHGARMDERPGQQLTVFEAV